MPETKGIQNIHGKEYETVPLRVHKFRAGCPITDGWEIETKILEHDRAEGFILMKAVIKNPDGKPVGNGHAAESRNANNINRTSYIENCETSAIGRALAACGLGGESFCSAEELTAALENQQSGTVTGARNEPELISKQQYDTELRNWAVGIMVDKLGEEQARLKHNELFQLCQVTGEYVDSWEDLPTENKQQYIKYMSEYAKELEAQKEPEQQQKQEKEFDWK